MSAGPELANPRKTTGVRKLGPVDIAALAAAVSGDPRGRLGHGERRQAEPVRGAGRHAPYRFPLHRQPSRLARLARSRGLARVARLAGAGDGAAVRDYGYARGVFPRVMLARMPPGGVIHPHIDANPAAKWPHKIHVPLSTNPGVVSFFGERGAPFPDGRGGRGQQSGSALGAQRWRLLTAST
jgi:hypothetical protein